MIPAMRAHHVAIDAVLRAAIAEAEAALNDVVAEPIALSVPQTEIADRPGALARLNGPLRAIRQRFRGDLGGEVMLILPESEARRLVAGVLSDALPGEVMTELESSTLIELGNLILNGILNGLGRRLGSALSSAMPQFAVGSGAQLADTVSSSADVVLFFYLDLALATQAVAGYGVVGLDRDSARRLAERLAGGGRAA